MHLARKSFSWCSKRLYDEYNVSALTLIISLNVCFCFCFRRECEFEDDCDSLAWEETEETLLLWEDFPGGTLPPDPSHPPGEVDWRCTTYFKCHFV